MDEKYIKALEKVVGRLEALEGKGRKSATGYNTANMMHGASGLFNIPVEQEIVNAFLRPMGIGSVLPLLPTVDENPLFGAISGYQKDGSARITEPCQDAPSGYMKGCTITAQFGLTRKDSEEIDIYKTIRKINRGDFTDLTLMGEVLGMSGLEPSGLSQNEILNIVTMSEMVKTAVLAEQELVVDMWQGTIGTGAFPGLDSQIATGIVDAKTNTACPSLDSDVKDFGYSKIDGTDKDIVEYVSVMHWYLNHIARRTGLAPTQWIIATHPDIWFDLTAIWACRYLTNRCTDASDTNVAVVNDETNTRVRDAMRDGMFLWVNGRKIPVVLDDGIIEKDDDNQNIDAGEFATHLYFVPVRVRGSFPATYRQYLDYSRAAPEVENLNNTEMFWSDNGVYSWAVEAMKWCVKYSLRSEQRIVLRTPHLAGKIQNIKFAPLQHLRSPLIGNDYNKDGGVSFRSSDTLYSVWGDIDR